MYFYLFIFFVCLHRCGIQLNIQETERNPSIDFPSLKLLLAFPYTVQGGESLNVCSFIRPNM